jgi:serine/threonine-protein kinase
VLDFGVAKAVGRLQDTDSGQIKGKIAYMAPEQLTSRPVDRRADVFAAGVVLWEALAGRRLFAAESSAETMYRVLETAVPRLSEYAANLPPALIDAVGVATAKEPDGRFPTALDFARELEKSVELVPNHLVGQWVRGAAGASLEAKRSRVRAIEAAELPADGAPVVTPPTRSATASSPYARAAPDEITRAEKPVTVATRADRVQRPALAIFAVLLLAGVVGLLLRGRSGDAQTETGLVPAQAAHAAKAATPAALPSAQAPAEAPTSSAPVEAAQPAAKPSAAPSSKASASKRAAPARPKVTQPRKPESLFSRE